MQGGTPVNAAPRGALLVAGWFGCGYAPVAPGTVGSAAAVAVAFVLVRYCHWPLWSLAALAVAALWPAFWAAGEAARHLGKKDPRFVVVDEVVGQWITIAGLVAPTWQGWLAAFLLFRALDIWKPPPARRLESLPGGAGIVMDDVVAGAYGALVLFLAGCFNLY